jgi:3-oxoacyl-[acyl-carrier-protein] synthase II
MQRVAVTGIGAICGLGNNLSEVWNGLVNGKSGISKFEEVDEKFWPIQIAGRIKDFTLSEDILDARTQGRNDIFIHYAIQAAHEAISMANLNDSEYDPYKMGSILGVGMGGFQTIEKTHINYIERGSRRVSPFFIPSFIANMSTGLISIQNNFRGVNYTIASACASASHAIGTSATEIMLGRQDVMITGGSEGVLSGLTMTGFNAMKALSKRTDDPTLASRPFDKDRDGFVMGEGAGVLVLENYEKAKARGANILAEVVGLGQTSDAHHITAPHPEGEGTIPCMQQSLEMAGIKPDQIDYINAHGTSTPLGDIAETKAIKKVFGDHAYKLNVSSSKSMTGHLLGAAGGIESVVCVKSIVEQTATPTINLDNPDPECDLNYTANQAQKRKIEYALSNSFGFGGTNSTLVFKKC